MIFYLYSWKSELFLTFPTTNLGLNIYCSFLPWSYWFIWLGTGLLFSLGSPLWTSAQFPKNSYIFFLFRFLPVTPTLIFICWTCILFVSTECFSLASEPFSKKANFPHRVTKASCLYSDECILCYKWWMYIVTQKKAVYHNMNAGP